MIWATGMATGVILLDVTPGYQADLMSYLFGSILTVPALDLAIMLALVAALLISVGGRAFFYGLAPNEHHRAHPHFYCKYCGNMECREPESLVVRTDTLDHAVAGAVENISIRVDGVCRSCQK